MEQLNRIELRGVVGSVNSQVFSGSRVVRFTVATNRAYRDKDGNPVIETEWHSVSGWEGRAIPDVSIIEKGSRVYLCGRMHYQKYVGSDGIERSSAEILASRIMVIDGEANLEYEMN